VLNHVLVVVVHLRHQVSVDEVGQGPKHLASMSSIRTQAKVFFFIGAKICAMKKDDRASRM
jgi:hypothetical protein